MADIVAAAGEAEPGEGPGGELQARVVDPLWQELEADLAARLAATTLDDLLRRAAAAGLRRPLTEPISFAI